MDGELEPVIERSSTYPWEESRAGTGINDSQEPLAQIQTVIGVPRPQTTEPAFVDGDALTD